MIKKRLAISFLLVSVMMVGVYLFGLHNGKTGKGLVFAKDAIAAQTKSLASPVEAIQDRDVYYPGTEDLAPDEMRVIATARACRMHAQNRRQLVGS